MRAKTISREDFIRAVRDLIDLKEHRLEKRPRIKSEYKETRLRLGIARELLDNLRSPAFVPSTNQVTAYFGKGARFHK